MFKHSKAQSLAEYLVIVVLVITALTVMQLYMKRGLQAVVKGVADELAPQRNADPVNDIDKGGFLLRADSTFRTLHNVRLNEYGSAARNYVINDSTNSDMTAVYSQGKLEGEFGTVTEPDIPSTTGDKKPKEY